MSFEHARRARLLAHRLAGELPVEGLLRASEMLRGACGEVATDVAAARTLCAGLLVTYVGAAAVEALAEVRRLARSASSAAAPTSATATAPAEASSSPINPQPSATSASRAARSHARA